MITAHTKLCMIIGDPVEHSLSPQLHNSAYKALDIDDQFVFVGSSVAATALEEVVTAIRTLGIRGLSCTMPHKEAILPLLDKLDPIAKQIGAANSIVLEDGQLTGYNTDWQGVVKPLEQITSLKGKHVAVLGAGGAAKAAVFGLVQAGAKVTIYNRTVSKAQALATHFGCHASGLDDHEGIRRADILCNMTSLGMGADAALPIPITCLRPSQIVFDAVYRPLETPLLKAATAVGAKTVSGAEMLLCQAFPQFKLYTNHDAPEAVMRETLYAHLRKADA